MYVHVCGLWVIIGSVPFVIGGGNDQSYPNVSALMAACCQGSSSIGVVNVDAHLDVRPLKQGKVHSGSPFRLMLEDGEQRNNTCSKHVLV